MKAKLLTRSEYARHRGVMPSAVTKAIQEGRITLVRSEEGRDLIDPAVADLQWQWNTRARIDRKRRPADGGQPTSHPPSGAYESARTRREAAEAELAELKLAEQRGELVRVANVRASLATTMVGLREALLQIPSRLGAVLAAESDQARVHELLEAELHGALAAAIAQDLSAPDPADREDTA